MLMVQRSQSKIKHPGRIELPGPQPFAGLIEADRVAQLGFAQFLTLAGIHEQALPLGY